MQPATLILNPYAGRWNVQKIRPQIEHELRAAGVAYEVAVSRTRGEATELARAAARAGSPVVIAAGGDGTMNQVANGLMQAAGDGYPSRLGLIPAGTGNDLATTLGFDLGLTASCRRIAAGVTRRIDVGQVRWENGAHWFANNSGLGLEAAVTVENDRLVKMKGRIRYIWAAVKCIARSRPWDAALAWPGGGYRGPVVLVSVGNTHRTGGAFYLTPHARPDDGLLDFLYAHVPSRLRLMRLLPMALEGKHIHEPEINIERSPEVEATLNPPTAVQCDGEIVATSARRLRYSVQPAALEVVG